MDNRDKILQLVRMRGPLLPSQINKEVKTNVLFASAMLAELVSSGNLAVSNLKIGGSPLYYIRGQEARLESFLNHINEKDQTTYRRLKAERIFYDREQDLLTRVSVRNIKDFAKPLEVEAGDQKFLFWKWYLLSQEEAEQLIKEKLMRMQVLPQQETIAPLPSPVVQEHPQERQESALEVQQTPQPIIQPSIQPATEREQLVQDLERSKRAIFERLQEKTNPKAVVKKPESKQTVLKEKDTSKEKQSALPAEEARVEKNEEQEGDTTTAKLDDDEFLKQIKKYFSKNNITLLNLKLIRKNSEFDFEILIPSSVGNLLYYCKAKNKKRCNDGDLSSIYIQAQSRKLPILFLTTGDLTKNASLLLKSEFKNMTIQQL
ncbi:TPA: hypothetical protein HA249_01530 [Candidatus Woesearchaeota archaeon]|nr:hypothetical protein [Candidatus Woesearchaeota archaeon]